MNKYTYDFGDGPVTAFRREGAWRVDTTAIDHLDFFDREAQARCALGRVAREEGAARVVRAATTLGGSSYEITRAELARTLRTHQVHRVSRTRGLMIADLRDELGRPCGSVSLSAQF